MGFMDKLKNIFFEEEETEEVYTEPVEVSKPKEKEVEIKKVEVPRRRVEKKEEVEEMTPQEIYVPRNEVKKEEVKVNKELIFDDEDFLLQEPVTRPKKNMNLYPPKENPVYKSREVKEVYKKEEVVPIKETPKYEYNTKPVNKEKKFTPSPVISPIYGILDKNYKKEEIVTKKEVRLSTHVGKMDLDSVRNKAFGDLENDLFEQSDVKIERDEKEEPKEVLPRREPRKIYDMTKKDKPTIERVTLAEADEYFNDLGLAYNTDYKDISKEINDGRYKEEVDEDKLEDNLFDLIESMYDKED